MANYAGDNLRRLMATLGLTVEQVRSALAQLPKGSRMIFSLYLLEGYDHDEIAEILEISSSTSRSQLSRAKQKLIAEMKKK